jgi:hypothetical protein
MPTVPQGKSLGHVATCAKAVRFAVLVDQSANRRSGHSASIRLRGCRWLTVCPGRGGGVPLSRSITEWIQIAAAGGPAMSMSFLDHIKSVGDFRVPGMTIYPFDEVLLTVLDGLLCRMEDFDEISARSSLTGCAVFFLFATALRWDAALNITREPTKSPIKRKRLRAAINPQFRTALLAC